MIALERESKGWIQRHRRNKYCRGKENKFSIGHVKFTSSRYTVHV